MKFRLKKYGPVIFALMSFGLVLATMDAFANPYPKYAGTAITVNFPSHAYYDYAIRLIHEFTFFDIMKTNFCSALYRGSGWKSISTLY
jgi:hypothetical protein